MVDTVDFCDVFFHGSEVIVLDSEELVREFEDIGGLGIAEDFFQLREELVAVIEAVAVTMFCGLIVVGVALN